MPSADLRLLLTPGEIARRTWSFGVEGGERIYAPYLKLLSNGRIGGHLVDTERRWALVDGRVVIYDGLDRRSTVFDTVRVDEAGRLALSGEFLLAPGSGTRHELREIETLGELKPAGDMTLIRRAGPQRRNLVVCGANAGSLHLRWPVDIPAPDRSWDLWVNWYGAPEDFGHDQWAELQTRQHGRGKWPGMHHLCQVGSPVWDYDYVAFIDDDLMLNWSSLNEVFALCRQFKLQLAQPALQPSEVAISHAITERNPDCLLRFTSFVETMCPVFSHDALLACAASFGLSPSGFGLDNVWPKLIGEPRAGMAVIDRVSMIHTRPMATTYDLAAAVAEGNELQRRFNATSRVLEYGSVLAEPRPR